MNKLMIFSLTAVFVFTGAGCTVVDPFIIALGLPLEVSVDLNGGNSWNEDELYVIEDEISEVSVEYLDDVKASRVNDITIFMVNPPASGTSSGTLSYALDGGGLHQLAAWSNVPFSSLAEPGVSVLDASVLTVNTAARDSLLNALQDTSGLPFASSVRIQTDGTTSVNVPAGTKIVARLHYQVDVEI
ncbi:MAG TPA: hypothetical protein VI932_05320 [Bacteroidota bacterium]|nr:hypothetical protein [Bacteroidota bacterium]